MMKFYKIVGSGNDFVVLDNRGMKIKNASSLARQMCERKFGVGADGMLLLENSRLADFRMRIFNPDGSEAEMCGNGLRCLVSFVKMKGITTRKKLTIETKAGLHKAYLEASRVRVGMSIVEKAILNRQIKAGEKNFTVHTVNTGVPHAIIMVDNVSEVDVSNQGPVFRFHESFGPSGTNVDWVEVTGSKELKIRTYERGVEAETLSCGTGSVAAAIISYLLGRVVPPVNIKVASGETLKVIFNPDLTEIFLEGQTFCPFTGIWLAKK